MAVCWGNVNEEYLSLGKGFTAISGGSAVACGLKENETVVCWRKYFGDYIPIPHQNLSYLGSHISHAYEHNRCGIRRDDSAFCWFYNLGYEDFTVSSPPLDEKFLEIGTGVAHACGLLVDGSINCWGKNFSGQISPPSTIATPLPAPPTFSEISEICEQGNIILKGTSCKVSSELPRGGYFKFTVTKSGLGILYEGVKLRETQYGRIESSWTSLGSSPSTLIAISAHANAEGNWTIDTVMEWE